MAGPDYGALGATFKITRALQVISLLACIGMAANFISQMVQNNDEPSKELVGTLSVVCPDFQYPVCGGMLTQQNRPALQFSIA